ncbi:hypothetical protein GMMP15_810007 [Candidatus Magnetomoraceae bacterium gMMP-15]
MFKIKLVIGIAWALWITLLLLGMNPVVGFADEVFWIQEGELKFKIKDSYLYLSNQREGGTYYYNNRDEKYIPSANDTSLDVLKFKVIGKITEDASIHNFEFNKWNKIRDLTFKSGQSVWKVQKEKNEFLIFNEAEGIDSFERDYFPPIPFGTIFAELFANPRYS